MTPNITEVVQRYEAGESTTELGKAYGVASTTVRSWLMNVGVKLRPVGPPAGCNKKDLPVADIVRLYTEERIPARHLAQRYGVATNTIIGRLELAGVKIRGPGRHSHFRKAGGAMPGPGFLAMSPERYAEMIRTRVELRKRYRGLVTTFERAVANMSTAQQREYYQRVVAGESIDHALRRAAGLDG